MKTYEDVRQVVSALTCYGETTDVMWWIEDETKEVKCGVMCNDVFFWGCADVEELEAEDVPMLKEIKKMLFEMSRNESGKFINQFYLHGDILFCAKKRKMRPQGAMYKHIPKELWHLFNECGEHRPEDFGNPIATPENP